MNNTRKIDRRFSSNQRGAALIVSLLMLLVMTVIGVAAMQTNLLEEKMAGNFRDVNLAFQAAEAALRDAEADIRCVACARSPKIAGLTNFDGTCSNGLCDATGGFPEEQDADPPLDPVWKAAATEPNGVALGTYTSAAPLPQVACQPRYWIEGHQARPAGSPSWKVQYRITAVACGGNANTRVVLQSVYAP
ncbi:MAG: PilX N-terminal domain-containing pilus assembly protein [Methylohalobius crimeensis]